MILADDLIIGLLALQDADAGALKEPENGYCLAGFSFTPEELFAEIRRHHPGFTHVRALDPDASLFARLWPDSLSPDAAERDLGFAAEVGLVARCSGFEGHPDLGPCYMDS